MAIRPGVVDEDVPSSGANPLGVPSRPDRYPDAPSSLEAHELALR